MAKTSPTSRTLKELSRQGWIAQVVEKWIPYTLRRKDLFDVIDVLAIRSSSQHDRSILGVQATTGSHVWLRLEKSKASPNLKEWLRCGGKYQVWGWRKAGKRKRWKVRIVHVFLLPSGRLLIQEEPMKLEIEDLPADLRQHYGSVRQCNGQKTSPIHKAHKKGASTIIVHTIDRTKEIWKKVGKSWVLQ